jgi:hypothetical protein
VRAKILIVLVSVLLMSSAFGQQNKFTERLLSNRYELSVQEGRLNGNGAPILQSALDGAQFVLIGEDHGIAQIPEFAGAVCGILGPQGFHTMAVETGPLVAADLEKWAASANGQIKVAEFEKKFPDSIPFYNFQEEFGLLKQCGMAAGGKLHVWGLDQEFLGSSSFIFEQILETHPGKEAEAAVKELIKKDGEAHGKAGESGKSDGLFMLSANDADLTHAGDLLRKEGSAKAQELFAAFMKSREIYRKNIAGDGIGSNRQRALLMKTNFIREYAATTRSEGKPPKVLFKFGGNHMYKGLNQLHNNDIGNYILELADGQGSKSVNILILAVAGSQLAFAGVGRPYHAVNVDAQDKNSDIGKLKPMFENMNALGWTMFDLRGMRKGFSSLGQGSKDVENIVFAYDFLILIPEAKPSTQIR